jgi:uncharacterized protein (TIGR04255 family)
MAISFPDVRDIPLRRSPLQEVVCQVRFPTILRLLREVPDQFQTHIQAHFPSLDIERPFQIEKEVAQSGGTIDLRSPVYRFTSADKSLIVSLGVDFFALTTRRYEGWSAFADKLAFVSDAAQKAYELPYAERIGLRYINVVGVEYTDSGMFLQVLDLIRPELTVMLRLDAISDPDSMITEIRVPQGAEWFTLRYGVGRYKSSESAEPSERGFLLDFDHYVSENVDLSDLLDRCSRYHDTIYRAFRWCIAEDKLAVFEPIELPDEENQE